MSKSLLIDGFDSKIELLLLIVFLTLYLTCLVPRFSVDSSEPSITLKQDDYLALIVGLARSHVDHLDKIAQLADDLLSFVNLFFSYGLQF